MIRPYKQAADVLAILCINICRMTDPEVIIFAGGMSRAGDKLLSRVRERIKVRAWTCLPQTTPLVVASAAHAGSVGAAVVAGKNAAKQARACVAANKIARRCCDLNVIVAVSSTIVSFVTLKYRSADSFRCPLWCGVMLGGFSSVAIYSALLSFLNPQK